MTELISNDALYEDIHQVIIDVRSPSEYADNHIYGAINIPLFSDEERHNIGKAYKQESIVKAKKLGMTYIASKIEFIGHRFIELSETYDRVIVYCQRGGMRSQSICDLMNALDIKVYKLNGGMKSHRLFMSSHMNDMLSEKTFITLHGHTGVGKTKILEYLKSKGMDVINYEVFAQNAGSVFGNILFSEASPSQKYFEEQIFHTIKTSHSPYIFVESESKRVGTVLIPDPYMNALEVGKHILIETDNKKRIENLIEDYGDQEDHLALIEAINKLRKRISNDKANELINYVKDDNLVPIVEYLLVDYYDPLYQYSIDQYQYDHRIQYQTIDEAVTQLLHIYQKGI